VAKEASSTSEDALSARQYETVLYTDGCYSQLFHKTITSAFDDLEEIAKKAIVRYEPRTARAAAYQIGEMLKNYLRSRQRNLLLYPTTIQS
jgi:hypothetical protein